MSFTLTLRATLRRGLLALATFGVVFLAVLLVATLGLDVRNSVALPVAAIVGLAVAGAVYLRERTERFDPAPLRSSR